MARPHRLAQTAVLSLALTMPVAFTGASASGRSTTSTACGQAPAGYTVIESNQRFITGTPGPDFICAGSGNNIIRARGKDDIIYGGSGNDVIWAGYGNDIIYGGSGNDLIRAGGGKDEVLAGYGDDLVFGGDGADVLVGGQGNDQLTGGGGHDSLEGGDGADELVGNIGTDQLVGGNGTDVLQGGLGPDSLLGGNDADILNGGEHDDTLGGGNGNDRLVGGNGNDALVGGNGNDALIGGGHADELRGSAGDDILDGGNGLNLAIGGPGGDHCKNSDDPKSVCEIMDGIEVASPTHRVWLFVPSADSPVSILAGTHWTANAEVEITIVDPSGDVIAPTMTVRSNDGGYWELVIATRDLTDATIRVDESAAGRKKTLTPALVYFAWDPATEDLVIAGEAGETVEAHITDQDDVLVFVEQMTLNRSGVAEANFSEVENIALFELRRSDDDGDVEIHSNVTG